MSRACAACLLAALAWAQQPPKNCTVEGTVTDARSGGPVANATFVLFPRSGLQPQVFESASDAAGRFVLKDVAPGAYSLAATARGHSRSVQPLNCPGATQDLRFVLAPEAVISGRVSDDAGKPVRGALITLLRPIYAGGERRLIPAGATVAGQDGQYRIENLPDGTYYVEAAAAEHRKPGAIEALVPTFYPGAVDTYAAAPIRIAGPGEAASTDVRMRKARAVSLSGRLIGGERDYVVRLIPADLRTPGLQFTIQNEKGRFNFSGVQPGSYILIAHKTGSVQSTARQNIDVADRDIDGIELPLAPGIPVTGTLTFADGEQHPLPPLQLDLLSWEDLETTIRSNTYENQFAFSSVSPGIYRVMLTRLPPQAYAVTLRVDSRDVPDWIADLTGPPPHTAEIVVGFDAGRVSGYARNASGDPAPKMLVTLVPSGTVPLTSPRFATIVSDDQGRYLFTGVQPGAYKVFAWEKVNPGAVQNRETLRQFQTQCADIDVQPNGTANADVTAIPASATASLE